MLLVDDHALVRDGLRSILAQCSDITVIGEADNGKDALRFIRQKHPHVVVLDLSMPDMDGIEVTKRVVSEALPTRILILTMHVNEQYATRLLRAGAHGFIGKGVLGQEVAQAIRTVAAGECYLPLPLLQKLPKHYMNGGAVESPVESLSDQELQVLKGLAEGQTSWEIGDGLHLSGKTIDSYRARLLTKLNLSTTADLIRFALHHKVIEDMW